MINYVKQIKENYYQIADMQLNDILMYGTSFDYIYYVKKLRGKKTKLGKVYYGER